MKRLALVAVVVSVAACTTKDTKSETNATTDSAAMMAPAPATSDTAMRMSDTSMKMSDTTASKTGTTKKP